MREPMPPAEYAVQCRNVTKVFQAATGEVHALRGIDLDIPQGQLFMLVGPSGCGKTTLISVIAAIMHQTSGACLVHGLDLNGLSDAERTKYRGEAIGFVFQSFNLIPTLSNAENVAVPLLINRIDRTTALRRATEMLDRVGLAAQADRAPTQLSGGQQQRVAIARALVHNPRLVVCDEPTSALDHDNGARVMEIFRSVALEERRTLIVVTHDARIFSFADRIAKLDDGRVVWSGPPAEYTA